MKTTKQINNYEFVPSGSECENPVYFINECYPNPYYGKENEFVLAEDGESYYKPGEPNNRINKSCFENK